MGAASDAGKWVWENRSEIRKLLKSFFKWFRKKQQGILILGAGGTGKSTLGRILSGEFDYLFENPGIYAESVRTECYKLKGKSEIEIVVPPGQRHRRESTWSELYHNISGGKYHGVVILSSYGYHSLGSISLETTKRRRDATDSLAAYLKVRRDDELNILKSIAPHVGANSRRMWLMTAVTKQDLWWPDQNEVERYYTNGPYGREIKRICADKQEGLLRNEVVFASLVISNFTTGAGDLLKQNVAGYDHQLHIESLRRLFETVNGLKDWESK